MYGPVIQGYVEDNISCTSNSDKGSYKRTKFGKIHCNKNIEINFKCLNQIV